MTITYDDFERVDIRVGRITRAEPYPEARKPAIKLWVDFGPEIGEKRSSAQITRHYQPEELIGRQVMAVVKAAAEVVANVAILLPSREQAPEAPPSSQQLRLPLSSSLTSYASETSRARMAPSSPL